MKKIFAVVIGCNYSSTPYSLDGCINDAMDFSWTITDLCEKRNLSLNLNLLLDDGNNRPTGANVLANIRQGVQSVNSGQSDLFIFYFAGHGLQQKDNNGDESDGLDETILCSDLTQIVDDQLFLALTRLRKNRQAVFIFDCCHSGTMLDLPKTMIGGGKSGRMQLAGDVLCLSACLENQKSTEKNGRGLFTSALCATLRKRGGNTPLLPLLRTTQKYVRSQTNNMTLAVTASGSVRAANLSLFNLKRNNKNTGHHKSSQRGIGLPVFLQHGGQIRKNKKQKGKHRHRQHRQQGQQRQHHAGQRKHRHQGKNGQQKHRGEPIGLKNTKDGKCVMSFYPPWKERKSHRTCGCQ